METGKSTEQIIKQADSYVMQTYSRLPLALVRGEGPYVWDAEGRRHLDFLCGLGVNSLGHRHPAVTAAIREAADTLLHCSNLYYIPPQGELAERLCRLSGLDRVVFVNSGAEANEAAIKLARSYAQASDPQRHEIITATRSFHGRTLAALAATGQSRFHDGFAPLPAGFRHVPFNDLAALEAAVSPATCAVMLEPIQGESGVRPADPEYLQGVRELCDRRGLLLIFDEVQTGIGRTGHVFAFEHYGVRPDAFTLAKALGGGAPIGALVATEEAAKGLGPGRHGSTFGGNPLASRAALAVLDVLEAPGFLERVRAMGAYLRAGLEALAARRAQVVAEVRGVGMMQALEVKVSARRVLEACQRRGLLVNAVGDETIRLLPPLILDEAQIDEGLQILAAAVEEAAAA